METNEQRINEFLNKAQATVDRALNELMEVNIIRENDPTEYSEAQRDLQLLNDEIEELMNNYPNEREKLHEVNQQINEIQKVLVRGEIINDND
ncbi:DUF2524 family protein [Anaerobacillus sp. MEB173]|uniref:DUF2524 family protein n=1 Tax=Anaerobacillus sp. MEB173 TaxID=3383345 RepID=UPI003F90EEB8